MKLEGKVAIVTGAGSGIGRAVALTLAKEGANVVVGGRHIQSVEKVAGEIKSLGRQALAVDVDVSKIQEVGQLVKDTLDTFKTIDILVNNAGITKMAPPEEETEAQWDSQIDINLKGTFLCSQAAGRQMIKQKRGKIINIASAAAHRGISKLAAYSASKGGVLSLTRSLAVDWAKYNINVNALSPGTTKTPIHGTWVKNLQEFYKERVKAIPLRRISEPEDIANAVLFLASSDSDNMTGQVIIVDGGSCCLYPGCVSEL